MLKLPLTSVPKALKYKASSYAPSLCLIHKISGRIRFFSFISCKIILSKFYFISHQSPMDHSMVHRGAFCQYTFRWIHYCHSSKSTGKETSKTHLCAPDGILVNLTSVQCAVAQFLFRTKTTPRHFK